MNESITVSDETKKIISLVYQLGFIDGMFEFAWMKNGVYHVGTTGTTFKWAVMHREEMLYFREFALKELEESKSLSEIVEWLENKLKQYHA